MSELRLGGGTYPALGINVPQPAASAGLGAMGQFAEIQNRINQNLMFQQSWKARAAAGEVLAQHPGDPEGAVQEMFSRPDIAPWAPQIGNEVMQMRNSTADYYGKIQTQTQDALHTFMQNSAALYRNPELWPSIVSQAQATTSPQSWPRVEYALDSLRKGLLEHTNPDGSTRQSTPEEFQSKLSGLMVSHLNADQYASVVGKPELIQQGAQITPALAIPGVGYTPARSPLGGTTPLPMGAAPSYGEVGGVTIARPGIMPGAPAGAGLGAPLPPNLQPQPSAQPQSPGTSLQAPQAPAASPGTSLQAPQPDASRTPGVVAPGAVLPVPSAQIQQKGLAEGASKMIYDHINDLASRIDAGRRLMQGVQEARNAMQSEQLGPQAAWRQPLSTFLSQIGASKDVVDQVAGGSFASMQELQKLFVSSTMGQLEQQLPKGSHSNRVEWNSFLEANPKLETDPNAIEKIFNFWGRQLDFNNAEAAQYQQYVSGGGNPITWPSEWTKRAKDQGLLSTEPVTGQAKGTQPLQHLEGKTVRQGGVTYRIQGGQAIPLGPEGQPLGGGQNLPAGAVQ